MLFGPTFEAIDPDLAWPKISEVSGLGDWGHSRNEERRQYENGGFVVLWFCNSIVKGFAKFLDFPWYRPRCSTTPTLPEFCRNQSSPVMLSHALTSTGASR